MLHSLYSLDRVFAPSQNIRISPVMQAEVVAGPWVRSTVRACVQTNFPRLEMGAQIVLGGGFRRAYGPGKRRRDARRRGPEKKRDYAGIVVRGTNQSRQEPPKAENDHNYGPGSP